MTARRRVRPTDDEYLTSRELADLLHVKPRTPGDWRFLGEGRGPEWLVIEGQVRYRRSDVDRWLESCRRTA